MDLGCLVWHGLGSLVPGVLVLLEPDLELLPTTSDVPCSWCHLNSLFLSVTSQIVTGLYLGNIRGKCFSLPLHGAVGSLRNLQGWRIPLLGSSMCSQLGISGSKAPELIPIASDPSQPQERDAVHWELWSAARLEHQKIHGMSGILFNNKNTTAFSELSG